MSREKTVATFDQWAEAGRADGMEDAHGDVVRQVIEAMQLAPGEKVLDLGCGNGWATRQLAQTAAGVQAVGVDASPKMIARADELHSFTIRARYDWCPFEALDFKDEEFDRVFSMEALYYAEDLDKALSELLRVMKPGARADIVLDFYKESPSTESWSKQMDLGHMHWKGEAEWRTTFEAAGFTDVSTSRVIDSRGPGDEASFTPDECLPTWADKVAQHEAGSLWIQAQKPA